MLNDMESKKAGERRLGARPGGAKPRTEPGAGSLANCRHDGAGKAARAKPGGLGRCILRA